MRVFHSPLWIWLRKTASQSLWRLHGEPVGDVDPLKLSVVSEYGRRFSLPIFIETGTYLGNMVEGVKTQFGQIHSIELDPVLAQKARRRFRNEKHITIYQGDSGNLMPVIIDSIRSPCLYWLDAHYSQGITTKGDSETPIVQELKAIFSHPYVSNSVILIDDARCFDGRGDYPSLEEVTRFVDDQQKDFVIEVRDDIIRIFSSSNPIG